MKIKEYHESPERKRERERGTHTCPHLRAQVMTQHTIGSTSIIPSTCLLFDDDDTCIMTSDAHYGTLTSQKDFTKSLICV